MAELPKSLRATNPAAEKAYVKALRRAAQRARVLGVRPTTMLCELLVQAAASHSLICRDKDDFLKWAGELYDDALECVKRKDN